MIRCRTTSSNALNAVKGNGMAIEPQANLSQAPKNPSLHSARRAPSLPRRPYEYARTIGQEGMLNYIKKNLRIAMRGVSAPAYRKGRILHDLARMNKEKIGSASWREGV